MRLRPATPRTPKLVAASALAVALVVSGPPAGAASGAVASEATATSTATSSNRTSSWATAFQAQGFTRDVRSAPEHANSRGMVANLAHQVTSRYNGVAAFNVHKYSVPISTAGPSQRRVDIRFDDCQGKDYEPEVLLGPEGAFLDVPIPGDAIPSSGSDGHLAVFSPSTGQLWEFWHAKKTSKGWSACWGGRLDRVSRTDGAFAGTSGASASGISLAQGVVRMSEARAGRIGHALTLSIPEVGHRQTVSYPARRSDGSDKSSDAIPMGTRFRLDPSLDVRALHLHPLAESVALAAQRYGFIVSDSSGAVSVSGASGDVEAKRTGVNPWTALLDGTPTYAVLEGFPWDRLEALPEDWGQTP